MSLKQQVINLFLQKGSTKDPDDIGLAMESIRGILGGIEGRCSPPMLIVGDEETYRFLHDLRVAD